MNKELYQLTTEEFLSLQQSGLLYRLYPSLQGEVFNVGQFEQKKSEYILNELAYNFVFDLIEMSGVDPAEFLELFETHLESIKLMVLNWEHVDVVDLIESLRG
jgi:hypothetical protein